MYIKDGICYAGSLPEEIRVSKIIEISDEEMKVKLSDGMIYKFKPDDLKGSAFKEIKKKFKQAKIERGVIIWDAETDLAPEWIKLNAEKQE